MITSLHYPAIDRLLDRFKLESKQFFPRLNRNQRKELRKYINYRKAEHKDNWNFSPFTAATLEQVNHRAEQFYLQHLKYTQLKLPVIACFQYKDFVNIP